MDVLVWPGTAHAGVARSVSGHHVLRLRESAGSGAEAVAADRLHPVHWRAGALEYLPPGADHSHRTDLASDWISIALTVQEWDALVDLAGCALNAPVTCRAGRALPKASQALRGLRRAVRTAAPGDIAPGLRLAALLLCQLARPGAPRAATGLSAPVLQRVTAFVDAELAEPLTVPALAAIAGLTPFHFITAFERSTGQTPHQYLLSRRLARARGLLRAGDLNIASVAAECGLASHAHLCALFADRYGCTPGAWRKGGDAPLALRRDARRCAGVDGRPGLAAGG